MKNEDDEYKNFNYITKVLKPDEFQNVLAEQYFQQGLNLFLMSEFLNGIGYMNKCIEVMLLSSDKGKFINENALAKSYWCRASAYHTIQKHALAIEDFTKSITIWENIENYETTIDMNLLLNAYLLRGETYVKINDGRAIHDYEKVIEITDFFQKSVIPYSQDDLASAYFGIGNCYGMINEYEMGNDYFNQSINIWTDMCKEGDYTKYDSLALAYMNRGGHFYMMNMFDEAIADYNTNINIQKALLDSGAQIGAYSRFISYINRSMAYELSGNIKPAIRDAITSVNILKEEFQINTDFQEIYYDVLHDIINMFIQENDETGLRKILEEYLYPMHQVPKTVEATNKQNEIYNSINSTD